MTGTGTTTTQIAVATQEAAIEEEAPTLITDYGVCDFSHVIPVLLKLQRDNNTHKMMISIYVFILPRLLQTETLMKYSFKYSN